MTISLRGEGEGEREVPLQDRALQSARNLRMRRSAGRTALHSKQRGGRGSISLSFSQTQAHTHTRDPQLKVTRGGNALLHLTCTPEARAGGRQPSNAALTLLTMTSRFNKDPMIHTSGLVIPVHWEHNRRCVFTKPWPPCVQVPTREGLRRARVAIGM